jgi:hypothetical protein
MMLDLQCLGELIETQGRNHTCMKEKIKNFYFPTFSSMLQNLQKEAMSAFN